MPCWAGASDVQSLTLFYDCIYYFLKLVIPCTHNSNSTGPIGMKLHSTSLPNSISICVKLYFENYLFYNNYLFLAKIRFLASNHYNKLKKIKNNPSENTSRVISFDKLFLFFFISNDSIAKTTLQLQHNSFRWASENLRQC